MNPTPSKIRRAIRRVLRRRTCERRGHAWEPLGPPNHLGHVDEECTRCAATRTVARMSGRARGVGGMGLGRRIQK